MHHSEEGGPLNRFIKFGALGLLLSALAVYLGDAGVFAARVHRGDAYREISVNQFLVTPLKGQKEEYDLVGSSPVTCARAIFPRAGVPACWWLERHTSQWQ